MSLAPPPPKHYHDGGNFLLRKRRKEFEEWKKTGAYRTWRKNQWKLQARKYRGICCLAMCAWCEKPMCKDRKTGIHIDHVMSLADGGSNDPSNLVLTHAICNMRKGRQTDYVPLWIRARMNKRDKRALLLAQRKLYKEMEADKAIQEELAQELSWIQ